MLVLLFWATKKYLGKLVNFFKGENKISTPCAVTNKRYLFFFADSWQESSSLGAWQEMKVFNIDPKNRDWSMSCLVTSFHWFSFFFFSHTAPQQFALVLLKLCHTYFFSPTGGTIVLQMAPEAQPYGFVFVGIPPVHKMGGHQEHQYSSLESTLCWEDKPDLLEESF